MRAHAREVARSVLAPWVPVTYELQTNFDQVRGERDTVALGNYQAVMRRLSIDPAHALRLLTGMLNEAQVGREWMTQMRRASMRKSIFSIQSKVRSLQTGEKVATVIQKLSVTSLVALAAVSTGGGSVATAGAWEGGRRFGQDSAVIRHRQGREQGHRGVVGAAAAAGHIQDDHPDRRRHGGPTFLPERGIRVSGSD